MGAVAGLAGRVAGVSWRERWLCRPLQVTEAQRGPRRPWVGERDAEGPRVPAGGGKCGKGRYRWQAAASRRGLLPRRCGPGSRQPKRPRTSLRAACTSQALPAPGPRRPSRPRTSRGNPGVCPPGRARCLCPHLPSASPRCPAPLSAPHPLRAWRVSSPWGRRGHHRLGNPEDPPRSEPLRRRFAGL